MSGRCVELREMSPGGREMVTSGGEREERQAWTHDSVFHLNGSQALFFSVTSNQINSCFLRYNAVTVTDNKMWR